MNFLFHKTYLQSNEKRRKAELLVISIFISLFISFIYLGISIYASFSHSIYLILIAIFILAVSLALLKTPIKLKLPGNLSIAATNFLTFACMYLSGGIHSPLIIWMISPPIIALLTLNRFSSYIWAFISVSQIGILIYLDWLNIYVSTSYNSHYDSFFYFSSFLGVMVVLFIISLFFENSFEKSQKSVEELNKELLIKNEELNIQTEEIVSQRDMLYDMTREMELHQGEVVELNEQLEERISSRTNELFNAMEELDTFIYRSAHDIKGPLATISGLCYVAMFDVKDEKSASYLAKIQIQTQKTIQLLQRISGISELKKTEPTASSIDFKLIQLKLSRYLQEEEDSQLLKIKINLPDNEIEFWSDQNLIESALIDLLDNAVKFRDSFKNEDPYVNLDINIESEQLTMRIEDNGLGIHETIKPFLFDMFFKGSDKSKGSGLGLFIVKLTAEKLNGTVLLDSSRKGKTIFTVIIPQLPQKK